MYNPSVFESGGYRFLPSVFQYSAGVAALPGYELEHARFVRPVSLSDGYLAVEQHLARLGRPLTAFAHCELRSPGQMTDQGFVDFNRKYVETLARWGIYRESSTINPVARTNVCPELHGPTEVMMHAFSYTVPACGDTCAQFILSGGGDARSGPQPYRERIVAYGDVSEHGLRLKMAHVIHEMELRLQGLGFAWEDVQTAQAYTVHDIGSLVRDMLARGNLMAGGLLWHFARPPVAGLEYEMDLKGAVRQIFIE